MAGARAASNNAKRRMLSVSQPVQEKSSTPQTQAPCSARACVSVSSYQGRKKRLRIRAIEATPPAIALFRSRFEISIPARAYINGVSQRAAQSRRERQV